MEIKYKLGDLVVLKANPSRAGVVIASIYNPKEKDEKKKNKYTVRFGDLKTEDLFEFELTTEGSKTYLHESGNA